MNRNKNVEISELANLIANEKNESKIKQFFSEMFTVSELDTLSKRWRIIKLLKQGYSQRQISKELGVSLCKVTRGSQILKKKDSVIKEYIDEDKYYGNN